MSKRYSIVGTQHTGLPDSFVAALKAGVPAVLVREPDNQYDKNAIAVYVDGQKVGYVPKNQNAVLAQFIDQQGRPFGEKIAQDAASSIVRNAIDATFVRSPNSGFPMVEV